MATLLALRTKLNGELGVLTDGETVPWSSAVRNAAISDGYAELWRQGVWKAAKQDITTVSDQILYPLTSLRRLNRMEILDSAGHLNGTANGIIDDDGAGGYQVILRTPLEASLTLRVWGWGPYTSTFSGDTAVDDLPAELNRIPLLKAKVILYRQQLGQFARYGERQAIPAEMNLTVDQFIGIIAAAEREFSDACRDAAGQRRRVGKARSFR
jgi:hypothetical protein